MARLALDTNTPFKICVAALVAAIIAILSFNVDASKRASIAWEAIEDGATVIDVRTPLEFRENHLEKAINMPMASLTKDASDLDRNETIVVYCQSGNRASKAKRMLYDMGFHTVYNGGSLNELENTRPVYF